MQNSLIIQQDWHIIQFSIRKERRFSISPFKEFRMVTNLQNLYIHFSIIFTATSNADEQYYDCDRNKANYLENIPFGTA